MIGSVLRFFIELIGLSFILISINYFLLQEVFGKEFTALYYGLYGYFVLMVSIIQKAMTNALKKRPQQYVIVFMASMGIKIFLSLTILVVIMFKGIDNVKVFVLNFVVLYLVYSAFSISQMLKTQKSQVKRE